MESSSSIFLLILVQVVGILAKTENGREIIYSVVSGTAHLPCNITPPQGNLLTMIEKLNARAKAKIAKQDFCLVLSTQMVLL